MAASKFFDREFPIEIMPERFRLISEIVFHREETNLDKLGLKILEHLEQLALDCGPKSVPE